ncbi:hypothetical protein J6590_006067 [Homalodisca vitripennis]|nr:hypothetical protein J6590_006067 [Homalodisca vitripennis]
MGGFTYLNHKLHERRGLLRSFLELRAQPGHREDGQSDNGVTEAAIACHLQADNLDQLCPSNTAHTSITDTHCTGSSRSFEEGR